MLFCCITAIGHQISVRHTAGPLERELNRMQPLLSLEAFKYSKPVEGNLNPFHSYQSDATASKRWPEPGEGSQVGRRAPEEQHKGIPATSAVSQLHRGPDVNALMQTHLVWGNKQEKLDTCICLQDYDLVGFMRCGEMAPATGVLEWKDTERTGRRHNERVLPFMSVTRWSTAWGWMKSWPMLVGQDCWDF